MRCSFLTDCTELRRHKRYRYRFDAAPNAGSILVHADTALIFETKYNLSDMQKMMANNDHGDGESVPDDRIGNHRDDDDNRLRLLRYWW